MFLAKRLFLLGTLRAGMAIAWGQDSPDIQIKHYREILEASRNNSLAHYKIGEIYLAAHNYQSAANEFREALSGDLEPTWIEVWAHLNLGRIFDLTNQNDRAANEYRLAKRTKAYSFPAMSIGPRPSGDTVGPVALQKIDPEYTDEARLAGLEGTVQLSGVIGEDGVLRNLAVTHHLGLGLDEKAAESVQGWFFAPGMYQGRPKAMVATFAVDFFLPLKQSRWHLTRAAFGTPDGASRPTVVSAEYPPGDGVHSDDAIEEGKLLGAVGRQATATVVMRVNEKGLPVDIEARNASDKAWAPEAAAMVSKWRFAPGLKDGKPISIRCVLDLVWGPKNLTPAMLARLPDATNPDFGRATVVIPAEDVAGKTIVFSGYVKTENVTRGWTGIWWQVDQAIMPAELVGAPSDASGWQLYQLTIPMAADAKVVTFGALHTGDGTAWFDGLTIRINGEPHQLDLTSALDTEYGSEYEVQLDKQTFHTAKESIRIRHLPDVLQGAQR
jgi:hypothetical protein